MKLLDSFAWIEYFMGSKSGSKMRDYIEGNEPLYIPSICLTEIKSRYLKDKKDPTARLKLVTERSFVIPLSMEMALLAADIKQRCRLHTIGSIVYATSQHRNLILVTGDHHFKDLPNVEMV